MSGRVCWRFSPSNQKVFICKHGSGVIIYSYFCCKPECSRGQGPPQANFQVVFTCGYLEDLVGEFYHFTEGVVYVEDVRAYIHYHIKDLGTSEIKGMYMSELMGESGKIKPAY